MARRSNQPSFSFLQGSVAAFFLLVGIAAIANYNSDLSRFGRSVVRAFGGSNDPITLVIAILSVIAGAILMIGLFARIDSKTMYATGLVVLAFWALRIVYLFFVHDIFQPDLLIWLEQLAPDVIVLAALWMIARKYA